MLTKLRGMSVEDRAAQLGGGVGTLAAIGCGIIWLPLAYEIGQKRREERARAIQNKKQSKRPS